MFTLHLQRVRGRNCGKALLRIRTFCSTIMLQREKLSALPHVIVEKDSHITLIGINKEQTRNSVDFPTAQGICDALKQFETDDESPVAVLYGVGGSFCAGHDLVEFEQDLEQGNLNFLMNREGAVGPTRRHLHKPVVCAINGFCIGSGLELALLCDLRVMEDSALLGFFNRRLGVPISDGGTFRLFRTVGYSRALDLITTGRKVTGQEALSIGLINRLVATGTALGQAVHLAFSIAKFPQAALRHDRSSLYANAYGQGGFRRAIQNEVMNTSSDVINEMKEGVLKFKESYSKNGLEKGNMDTWSIREKAIPEWEKLEISYEKAHKKHS